MKKLIYERCEKMMFPVHKFNNNTQHCIFHKGFKFEKRILENGEIEYNAYNTRGNSYKEIEDEIMKMIIEYGVILTSDILSYRYYKKIINKYSGLVYSDKKQQPKAIEKYKKIMNKYILIQKNIVHNHQKHKELFV